MDQSQLNPRTVTSTESASLAPSWRGPLFVIGLWRSGTSLLYALLNKHPQISLMYEGDLYLLRPLFWRPGAGSTWVARWQFWNQGLERHRIDAQRIPSNISNLPAAMETLYKECARQKDALIWGEKSPHLLRHPPTRLFRDFPHARFLIIWRDPSAICRSVIRIGKEEKHFFGRRGMIHRTLMGYKRLKVECDQLISQGAPVHQIQYETLVKNPDDTMADICKFLGVSFFPGVASLEGADRSAIYEGKHHSLVKSERIVSSSERSEVLSSDLKNKIERYRSLWREESAGNWPIPSTTQSSVSGKPSFWERLVDQALYFWLRGFDSFVVLIYCFAPFWLLKRFRGFKHRSEPRLREVGDLSES
jgi:hypothetical protein